MSYHLLSYATLHNYPTNAIQLDENRTPKNKSQNRVAQASSTINPPFACKKNIAWKMKNDMDENLSSYLPPLLP